MLLYLRCRCCCGSDRNAVWNPTIQGKSLEGSAAFFVVAVVVIALISKTSDHWSEDIIGGIAAMIGTVVEFVAVDAVADNCTVPLSIALSMWSLQRWVFPRKAIIFGL